MYFFYDMVFINPLFKSTNNVFVCRPSAIVQIRKAIRLLKQLTNVGRKTRNATDCNIFDEVKPGSDK